ncbi:MAG TPA: hypothetical protein DHV69_05360 [Sphaerochaeta sp.]|nr:hypothetical protein [Sphaerochaeta sp.]
MATVDLPNGIQSAPIGGFPPDIGIQSTVVVLGAHIDFKQFGSQVDTVAPIHSNGTGIEQMQPPDR